MEKVVFFECRIDQLTSDLQRSQEQAERLKSDLAEAAQREVSLKKEIASAETRFAQAARERDEALRQAKAAHEERERFLGRLIEAEQVRQAGENDEGIDLAAFIAELRSEVISLRAAVANGGSPAQASSTAPGALASPAAQAAATAKAAQSAPAHAATPAKNGTFGSAAEAAQQFASAGRIGIGEPEREALRASARFGTRSEETLFTLSLRELSAPDAVARTRAAQRLKAIGPRAALPAVAAALNAEPDPAVRCVLLEVVAAAGDKTVLPLVQPHLSSDSVEVRLAALETAFRLGQPSVLDKALDDADALVRRRAAVLATGQRDGLAVLGRAAHDSDPAVRRVAVLGLGASAGAQAESALLAALDDSDPTVRRSAAKGLARAFGPEVFAVADLDAARRRREIRRLAALPLSQRSPAPAVRAHLIPEPARVEPAPAPVSAPPPEVVAAPAASSAPAVPAPAQPVAAEPAAPAAAQPIAAEPAVLAGIEEQVLGRVYASLRGQSPDDLAKGLRAEPALVVAAASALERDGRLVRRGRRWFVP